MTARTTLKNLPIEEKTRRIRGMMIYLLDCDKAYFAEVYALAAKIARDSFGSSEDDAYVIGCNVAHDYVLTHGQPNHN